MMTNDDRQVGYAVLDEADRMLDMGFEKDVRTIMRIVPSSRQVRALIAMDRGGWRLKADCN